VNKDQVNDQYRVSKSGDTYLRTLLTQGAKTALKVVGKKTDPRSLLLRNLCAKKHKNIAVVDQWKEKLKEEISRRDLFMLFWSMHARNSK